MEIMDFPQSWICLSCRLPFIKISIYKFTQLPIRNFYARSFIMLGFLSKMFSTYTHPFSLTGMQHAVEDRWTAKDVRNYGAYNDSRMQVIPKNYNKLD